MLQRGLERFAFQLGGAQPGGQCLAGAYGHDGVDDALNLAVELDAAAARGKLCALVATIQLDKQAAHGVLHFGDGDRAQQILAQLRQQTLVDIGAPPGCRVGARRWAFVLVSAAAVAAGIDGNDRAAAGLAAQQATEQGGVWPPTLSLAPLQLPRPGLVPQRLLDDAQLGRLADQPFLARASDRQALSGVGVFQPLAAIPHEPAHVNLIVEQAVAHLCIAHQGARGPAATTRARHSAGVETVDDAAQRGAGGDLLVNPAHVLGLLFVDDDAVPTVGFFARIAVGPAAGREPALELAAQAAVRFLAQIVEKQFVDQAARDAHHLAAVGLRVVPVGGADDADSSMLHPLDRALLLGQVTRDAIQPFDDEHVEAVGQYVGQQRLAAIAQGHRRRTADAFVGMHHRDGPAFTLGAFASGAQLVGDAVLTLVVSAVPGVQANSHVVPEWSVGRVGGR